MKTSLLIVVTILLCCSTFSWAFPFDMPNRMAPAPEKVQERDQVEDAPRQADARKAIEVIMTPQEDEVLEEETNPISTDVRRKDEGVPRSVLNEPCVDVEDPYYCNFEIMLSEACDVRPIQMMAQCRFSCNFC